MKHIKLFEDFINEMSMKPDSESDIIIDDITLEDERVISSAEVVGAIINSESEQELEDFFYSKYGQNAFKQGELAEIKKYWNEYQSEAKEKEAEEEKDSEGGGEDDPLADL